MGFFLIIFSLFGWELNSFLSLNPQAKLPIPHDRVIDNGNGSMVVVSVLVYDTLGAWEKAVGYVSVKSPVNRSTAAAFLESETAGIAESFKSEPTQAIITLCSLALVVNHPAIDTINSTAKVVA